MQSSFIAEVVNYSVAIIRVIVVIILEILFITVLMTIFCKYNMRINFS